MDSTSASGGSRFLPSTLVARLALDAARRQERPEAAEPAWAWVSYLPVARFVDVTPRFSPGRERLEATPEGRPGSEENVIGQAQEAIGTRVERLLSNFAFEAAARSSARDRPF